MTSLIKQPKRYTFLQLVDNTIQSELGGAIWNIGEWKRAEGELEPCKAGLHCSLKPYDAFRHVQGGICAEVDVRGEYISDCSKECWREMRIVNAYK